jgi:hypothetical protein
MSYDIELIDPITKEPIELDEPHHMCGGTYALGGTTRAHLNVTYNYGAIFRRLLGDEGIRTIYGKSGADSIPLLENAAAQLGDDVDSNYWKATDGNAKRALLQLAALAKMRPDAMWAGD